MTIADQINRLSGAKAAIKQSIENKGVEISDTALLDEYPALIDSIETGGGEGGDSTDSVYYDVYMARTKNETSYYELFKESTATTLDVSNLDTSSVTNMGNMFVDCKSLTSIEGLSNFDTSKVTTMYNMFTRCNKLTSLDLSNFDTSKVTNMQYMFSYSGLSTLIGITNWDTSSVTNMGSMFAGCKFTEIDVSNWDTSKVTNMSSMFDGCNNLTSLDVSNFDTSKVTNMYNTFSRCASLTSLDLSDFDTSSVTNMQSMIYYCEKLEEVDLRNFDMTNVTNMSSILGLNNKLHTIRLDNCSNDTINKIITSSFFPTNAIEGVTRKIYCKESEAAGLTAPTNWVFEYVEEPIPLYVSGQFSNNTEITEVKTMVNDTHTDLANMFNSCINLTTINTQDWDTSNVTDMSYMFNYCHKLITLDLSNFDTSNVTSMYAMFNYCSNLEEVDLRNFNISNATNVNIMFGSCYELHTLRLDNCSNDTINKIIASSNFPTGTVNGITRKIYCKQENITGLIAPNGWVFADYMTGEEIVPEMPEEPDVLLYVSGQFSNKGDITEVRTMVNDTHTSLGSMFSYCYNLASIIGIEDWDTSNVTNMGRMFTYCAKLITLDLSSFNTSKVTSMEWMFMNCSNLTTVDLSNFDMTNVTNSSFMFNGCYELHTVRLDNCSNATISKIVTSAGLPTGTINGITRKIYCKEANASGLTAPNGWEFIFVE